MVSDLKTFAHKRCKIAAAKKGFYRFFHFFSPFKDLFAPTSQSPISKLFRFSEFFGEKRWKEVVSESFAHKERKIAAQFFCLFFWRILPVATEVRLLTVVTIVKVVTVVTLVAEVTLVTTNKLWWRNFVKTKPLCENLFSDEKFFFFYFGFFL